MFKCSKYIEATKETVSGEKKVSGLSMQWGMTA